MAIDLSLVFPVAKFAGQQNFAELLGSFEIRSSVDLRNISGFIEDGAPGSTINYIRSSISTINHRIQLRPYVNWTLLLSFHLVSD